MLTAQHKLRCLTATLHSQFWTFKSTGHTIEQLLQPGMFDAPAKIAGVKLDDWIFVIAQDGYGVFVASHRDEENRLCFQAFRPVLPVAETTNGVGDLTMLPPKRPVGRPPTKSRAGV